MCFTIWVCYEFCQLDVPASEANCVEVLGNLLVLSALVDFLKRGEDKKSGKELEE